MCRTFVVAAGVTGGMAATAMAADPAPPPPSASAGPVEEVVVTSTRAEKVQDVPAPILSVSGDALEAAHIDNIVDLPKILHSADFHAYNANNAVVTARGLGAESVPAGQLGDIGIYNDGVYLARQNEVLYGLHDLENVRMDLGPQGTAYGRANIGGALHINSKKPSFTPEGDASLTIGTYNTRKYSAMLNTPVIDDIDAVRLSVYSDYQDGSIKNTADGRHVNESEARGIRFQNLFQKDNFHLRVIAAYDEIDQHAGLNTFASETTQKPGSRNFQQNATANARALTITNYVLPTNVNETDINHQQNFKGYDDRFSAQADWDLNDHLTLTSISSLQSYKIWPNNDGDHSALDIQTNSGSHNWSTQRTQELRLESKDNKVLDWVAGGYYAFDRDTQVSDSGYGRDAFAFYTLPNGTSSRGNGIKYSAQAFTESETEAVFGQATVHIDSKWSVIGGLRESWDRRTLSGNSYVIGRGGGNYTDAQIASAFSTTFGKFGGAAQSANLGAKSGLNYQATDDILVYTDVSRGYKPAGTQTGILSASSVALGGTPTFGQEKAIDGELGAKTQWLDKKLTVNVNAYRGADFGYQETVGAVDANGNTASYLANVKAVQLKGLELDGSYKITPELEVGTTSSYNLTTYQSYHNAPCSPEASAAGQKQCDLTGSRVFGSSRWTTNLWGELNETLADDVDGYIRTSYNHKSGLFLAANNTSQSWQPGYGTVNASIGTRLRGGAIDLSIWATNIFDTRFATYYTAANGANWVTLNDPATVGITAKVKF
jgi:iron complex outermembrane receptor protein